MCREKRPWHAEGEMPKKKIRMLGKTLVLQDWDKFNGWSVDGISM
jgi:hypothetical protein